jgi:uncharacterized protein (TIGR00661 family)
MKKILYGVCGIGNGHTQRQLPLIEHFSKENQIVIFAYDSSLDFYSKHYKDNPSVTVMEVAVPFYVGNKDGIDLEATKKLPSNNKDYDGINSKAIAAAEKIMGMPDVVITDYEPISAKVAYGHKVPLVTIDQQSKYLTGEFPKELHGQTYADEVARLKMFFPTAAARIACSFFDVVKKKDGEDVVMLPPIIKDSVLNMKNEPVWPVSILVYFSSQKEFPQNLSDIALVLSKISNVQFHIFAPNIDGVKERENVHLYKHGDNHFGEVLRTCSGIVSTAGHTLLSEAMYLGIPVYAIPLPVYEQQMNAEVIDKNGFGIRSESINEADLDDFIENIPKFRDSIEQDTRILLRGSGKEKIIDAVENIKREFR